MFIKVGLQLGDTHTCSNLVNVKMNQLKLLMQFSHVKPFFSLHSFVIYLLSKMELLTLVKSTKSRTGTQMKQLARQHLRIFPRSFRTSRLWSTSHASLWSVAPRERLINRLPLCLVKDMCPL
jgi:hypothetical protein